MKKTVLTIICVFILLGSVPLTALAFNEKSSTFNNNVTHTNTAFNINAQGVATVTTDYTGYKSVTTGATIKTKIQKRFLLVFWNDVATWTDTATGYYYSNTHSTTVEKGYYRAQVEYTIYGTGGSPDVITDELERSY